MGAPNGTAGGAVTTPGGGVAGVGTGTAGAAPSACVDQVVQPGEASLRRLTAFEFNNTVRDLLGDTTLPAGAFPAEDFGNGFGNDAKSQTVSRDLALAYADAAEAMAKRATDSPAQLAILAPCASTVTAANEVACARTFVENVVPRAYRRALVAAEADELVTLFSAVRPNSPDFKTAVASVLEAVLQWSDTEAKHTFPWLNCPSIITSTSTTAASGRRSARKSTRGTPSSTRTCWT